MTRLLDILRKRYSLSILDTPPVLLRTGCLTVGTRSVGMLFLLRPAKSSASRSGGASRMPDTRFGLFGT
jgi:hypothetical protein